MFSNTYHFAHNRWKIRRTNFAIVYNGRPDAIRCRATRNLKITYRIRIQHISFRFSPYILVCLHSFLKEHVGWHAKCRFHFVKINQSVEA